MPRFYAWDSFYNVSNHSSKGVYINTKGQYYINDCRFSNIANDKAINYLSSDSLNKLLVEDCTLKNISSLDSGGAIYFDNAGECCLHRLCASECLLTNTDYCKGHFCRITVSESPSHRNYMKSSSISSCGVKDIGFSNLIFQYGDAQFSKNNVSKCISQYTCGVYIVRANNESCEFCLFENCNSSLGNAIQFEVCQSAARVHHCELLHVVSSMTFTVYKSHLNIENCTLIDSPRYPMFHADSGTIIVIRCYFKDSSKSTQAVEGGSVDTNLMNTATFDLNLVDIINENECNIFKKQLYFPIGSLAELCENHY